MLGCQDKQFPEFQEGKTLQVQFTYPEHGRQWREPLSRWARRNQFKQNAKGQLWDRLTWRDLREPHTKGLSSQMPCGIQEEVRGRAGNQRACLRRAHIRGWLAAVSGKAHGLSPAWIPPQRTREETKQLTPSLQLGQETVLDPGS